MNQETSAAAEPPESSPAQSTPPADRPVTPPVPPAEPENTGVSSAADPEIVATPVTTGDEPVLEPSAPSEPPPAVPPVSASNGLPSWLPMFALAVVPAVLVGIIVFALAGSSGGGDGTKNVGGVLDFFFRQGSSPENVLSYSGRVPPNFPTDFPMYKGATIYAGFQILPESSSTSSGQSNGANFYVILSTPDVIDDVYNYYVSAFNGDIWAVEIARSSDEFTGVRFTRPDDPDVGGDVTLHRSELDNRTTIFLTYQDLTPSQAVGPADKNFQLGTSRPLPANFPTSDIPIYKSKTGSSVVTDTYIEKAPGGTSYVISFLTKDSQDDVVASYRKTFEDKGWTVDDATDNTSTSFQIGITFSDGPKQELQGTILADAFEDDTTYTKVDLLVQVASGRSRGN